ncbi:magnesium transporter MgtE N-terminal domain-containing protein [Pseudokineococcus lusitanus]|uniref:Mg/Co/Ni transporter MgtE n=1 Tax=Pseudokineococcus lusitanus TaxID=763993 RepID=A0A3N1HN38_9ACTN|nr:CBS domain-containing protein [Pseudokineococcus lusitanus]ROP43933.1 Mg/Co/Ni transporter MgtE [Pseudokineococcus lusitanus]
MSSPSRVFAARLAGLPVFDPIGDPVGRVRDVVSVLRGDGRRLRVVGLVVEVPGRRRVFVPLTRVTAMDAGQVITTGLVNLRRFEQRSTEVLLLAEVLERRVELLDGSGTATVEDLALERPGPRDMEVVRVFVRRDAPGGLGSRLRGRRGETLLVRADDVRGLLGPSAGAQGASLLVATFEDMKPADIADALHDLSGRRRLELAAELDDDRLADVLAELGEEDRVGVVTGLTRERAADVLEAMDADDAADVLGELPEEAKETLLQLMEPDEAADVRRLLAYDEETAGGLMTPEPVLLGPEATVAEALALVRRSDLSPALASSVYVCRAPLETPTGRLLGVVHVQAMLRAAPHEQLGSIVDADVDGMPPDAPLQAVARRLATYNLVSVPVTDQAGRLLGAVTVDDVLDHILPEDWREQDDPETATTGTIPALVPSRRSGRGSSPVP